MISVDTIFSYKTDDWEGIGGSKLYKSFEKKAEAEVGIM